MPSSVEHIIRTRPRDLGGFMVRRVLPAFEKQMVGPFIFLNHMGPIRFEPKTGIDVRPHPHIGLATVTYRFEGQFVHRDSLGSVQPIRPGDVNWMVAGRGIAHSERTPPELRPAGSSAHGVQTWVALPKAREETEPTFAHHPTATLPLIDLPGATVRVIADHAFGERAPVEVLTDTLYAAVDLAAGASMMLEPEHEERGVYVVDGAVTVGGTAVDAGKLAILAAGQPVEISAHVSSAARRWMGRASSGGTSCRAPRSASSTPKRSDARIASPAFPARRSGSRSPTADAACEWFAHDVVGVHRIEDLGGAQGNPTLSTDRDDGDGFTSPQPAIGRAATADLLITSVFSQT